MLLRTGMSRFFMLMHIEEINPAVDEMDVQIDVAKTERRDKAVV